MTKAMMAAGFGDYSMDDTISWGVSRGSSTAGLTVGNCWIGPTTYREWFPSWATYHYHYERPITLSPNPYEAAFKIVAKMLEKGIVEEMTLKKFVALVNDVATIVKES